MTTIAFKDGVMAADSQCTADDDDYYLTDCDKLHVFESGAVLGQAGDDDIRALIELLEAEDIHNGEQMPLRSEFAELEIDFVGLLYLPDGTLWKLLIEYDEDYSAWIGSVTKIKSGIAAVGSGCQFALGAMLAGASAVDAVKVACHFDHYSKEPVVNVRCMSRPVLVE